MNTEGENGVTYIWVVSTGSGYYAESVWTSEEAAWAEARRIGVADDGYGRAVKRWKINTTGQIWVSFPGD